MRALLITCITALVLLSAFAPKQKAKLKLPGEFARVPGGTFAIENPQSISCENKNTKTVMGFYMSKYEVSNLQYRQFFSEISAGLTEAEKNKILCDSSGWSKGPLRYCEPMRSLSTYYKHPGFNSYPVVNIRYEGALKYCEWLQKKIQKDNPGFIIQVQLPTKEQWTWAASGGRSNAIYPWAHWFLERKKGEDICNFKKVGEYAIIKNKETGEPEIKESFSNGGYPVMVKSYYPNDFGLYNMSGNVAEMISEASICMGGGWDDYGGDITTTSAAKYDELEPTVGFRPVIIVSEKVK